MKYKSKPIYCPQCGRRVGTHDGRSTMPFIVNCKKCEKRIVYDSDKKTIKIKDIPKRNCSSGMAFL